jgi:hypothetical protein
MTEYSLSTIGGRAVIAGVVAVVGNAALVAVSRLLGIAPGFEPIAYPPVVFLTLLATVAAAAVFGLVVKLTGQPRRSFRRLAAVVLLLSFVPDVLLLQADPAATVAGVVVLMFMHIVAAVVIVTVLTRGVGEEFLPETE